MVRFIRYFVGVFIASLGLNAWGETWTTQIQGMSAVVCADESCLVSESIKYRTQYDPNSACTRSDAFQYLNPLYSPNPEYDQVGDILTADVYIMCGPVDGGTSSFYSYSVHWESPVTTGQCDPNSLPQYTSFQNSSDPLVPSFCANQCTYELRQVRSPELICPAGAGNALCYTNTRIETYVNTGQSCSNAGGPPAGTQQSDPAENQVYCMTGSGGTVCGVVTPDSSCGNFNGELVCVSDVPENGCRPMGSGGDYICDSGASSPPAPDNGTPGQVATPDAAIDFGDTTYNYYTESTVTNSSSGASGTGGTGGSEPTSDADLDGTPDSEEDQEEEGSVSGGVGCDAPPVCTGDPVRCAQVEQTWRVRCMDFNQYSNPDQILSQAGIDPAAPIPEDNLELDGLDTSGWLNRQCPADIELSVMESPITIPTGDLCMILGWIGNLVLMGASVISARILVGGGR